MNIGRWAIAGILIAAIGMVAPQSVAGRAMQKKAGQEEGGRKENPQRAITSLIRGLQMDLESASSRGVLSTIDSAKFDDYPRFEDMVERLTRENTLRVYFRQANNIIKEDKAQTIIDGEMEMVRKDAAGQIQRRRQQIVIDFELTDRGWKIVNITPREFFQPL